MSTSRRQFLATSALAAAGAGMVRAQGSPAPSGPTIPEGRIKLSLKIGMCGFGGVDPFKKFAPIKKLGFDGIELNSPGGLNKEQCKKAGEQLQFPIHGVVNSLHWRICFSDPSAQKRAEAVEGLKQCIRDTKLVGGSAVLIVPGVVKAGATHQQVWDRSIACIKEVLPMASAEGVHILIENVWNGFLYDPKGDDNQSADLLKKYIDEINSPWVGSYFDIGNHQRFGKPAEWIRTLGKRIVKLDVKDWGKENGFCKIGEGDVDWADVRKALLEINYSGWATAEVKGGNEERCAEVLANMKKHILGA